MKRKRFTEEIIGALKAAEVGAKTADLARRLEVSEARRLKELQSENAKLKRLLADAMID